MSDSIGLLILGVVMLAYVNSPSVPSKKAVPRQPNVQTEPDLTRWKHDGTQTLDWTKGNGASFRDETAYLVHGMIA